MCSIHLSYGGSAGPVYPLCTIDTRRSRRTTSVWKVLVMGVNQKGYPALAEAVRQRGIGRTSSVGGRR